MLKKISILCLVAIVLSTKAQVIRKGNGQKNQTQTQQQQIQQQQSQQPTSTNSNSVINGDQNGKERKAFEYVKRSMVSVNLSQFVFTNVAIGYEFFTKDGKKGIKIPFIFGIGGQQDTNAYSVNNQGRFLSSKNRIFETGLNYNYYFIGQKVVSPYIGVGVNIGAFNYWEYKYTTQYIGYTYNNVLSTVSKNIGTNYGGALFAGVLINPNETITFGIKAGMGFRRYSTDRIEYTYPYGIFEVNLGFKF